MLILSIFLFSKNQSKSLPIFTLADWFSWYLMSFEISRRYPTCLSDLFVTSPHCPFISSLGHAQFSHLLDRRYNIWALLCNNHHCDAKRLRTLPRQKIEIQRILAPGQYPDELDAFNNMRTLSLYNISIFAHANSAFCRLAWTFAFRTFKKGFSILTGSWYMETNYRYFTPDYRFFWQNNICW